MIYTRFGMRVDIEYVHKDGTVDIFSKGAGAGRKNVDPYTLKADGGIHEIDAAIIKARAAE